MEGPENLETQRELWSLSLGNLQSAESKMACVCTSQPFTLVGQQWVIFSKNNNGVPEYDTYYWLKFRQYRKAQK